MAEYNPGSSPKSSKGLATASATAATTAAATPKTNKPGSEIGKSDLSEEKIIKNPIINLRPTTMDPIDLHVGPGEVVDDDDPGTDDPGADDPGTDDPTARPPSIKPPPMYDDGGMYPPTDEVSSDEALGNPAIIEGKDAIKVIPGQEEIFYNTVSCPCTTYVIKDSNGNIGCEREYYGVKQYFKAQIRKNHFIENNLPVLGNMWMCEDKTCKQSGYYFDGYYIVETTLNKTEISSAIVNSRRYTDNCFIPKSLNFGDYTVSISKEVQDYFDEFTVTTIKDVVIFKGREVAEDFYKTTDPDKTHEPFINYDFNGIKGVAPSWLEITNKVITGCWFDNKNLLASSIGRNFTEEFDTVSHRGLTTVKAKGEIIPIRINGLNGATFTLTIKDSLDCSILEKQIKNFTLPESGEYILQQRFPPISHAKTLETYNVTITPTADTSYMHQSRTIKAGVIKLKVRQFKDPTLTFSQDYFPGQLTNTCTGCGTHNSVGVDVALSGQALLSSGDISNFSPTIHTFTITRTSGTNYYYPKGKLDLESCIVRGDVIKKIINKKEDTKDISFLNAFYVQDIPTTFPNPSTNTSKPTYSGDIEQGMKFTATVEKTKTIRKIIDLDAVPDDDCLDCNENISVKTNKFEVDNTDDLFTGMIITNNNFTSSLISIDCEKSITIASEQDVHVGDVFVFSHTDKSTVASVNNRGKDGVYIEIGGSVRVPHGTELIFQKARHSSIRGTIQVDKAGGDAITVTTTIFAATFGLDDVRFTIDPNLFITMKPPNRDRYIEVDKNSTPNYINIISNYNDVNDSVKTVDVTGAAKSGVFEDPSKGALSIPQYRTYTPAANFNGRDKIKYTISDGVTDSDEKTIFITVK